MLKIILKAIASKQDLMGARLSLYSVHLYENRYAVWANKIIKLKKNKMFTMPQEIVPQSKQRMN
jgi:hypothetical protein